MDAPIVRRRQWSGKATQYGREHGMIVIDGDCPLIFEPRSDPGHKVIRLILTMTGKVPRKLHGRSAA